MGKVNGRDMFMVAGWWLCALCMCSLHHMRVLWFPQLMILCAIMRSTGAASISCQLAQLRSYS